MFWPLWPPSGNTQLCTKYLKESKSTENYKKKWDIINVLECCVELMNLYRGSDIITEISKGRLRWVGHVERTPEERTVKKVFKSTPE